MRNKSAAFCLLFFLAFLIPPGDSLTSLAAPQSEQTAVSRIDAKCQRTLGNFRVPPGTSARNFRKRQLHQGTNCKTGEPITFIKFAIKNLDTNKIVYGYDQQIGSGKDPVESPGPFKQLVLMPGNYAISVAGGANAVCRISFDLVKEPDSGAGSGTLKSWIDRQLNQHCATFKVPSAKSFRRFGIRQLDQGTNARTGLREQNRGFSIEKQSTGKTVFRFFQSSGEKPVEKPVKISELCLPPGWYRLCVAGGADALCVLEYHTSNDICRSQPESEKEKKYVWVEVCKTTGDLPNRWCPLKVKRKFEKGKEPKKTCSKHYPVDAKEAERARDEMTITVKIDEILEALDKLKDYLEEFDSKLKNIQNLEEAKRAQSILNQIRSALNKLKDDQRRVRYFADTKGIDISEAGSGDEWSRITLNINWIDNRIDLLESDIDGLKQAFTEEGQVILSAVARISRQLDILDTSSRELESSITKINSLQASQVARNRLNQLIQALRQIGDEMNRIENLAKAKDIQLKAILGSKYNNIAQKWTSVNDRLIHIKNRLDKLDNRFTQADQTILQAVDILFEQYSRIKTQLDDIRRAINTIRSPADIRAIRQRLNLSRQNVNKIKNGFSQIKSIAQEKGIDLIKLMVKRYAELNQNITNLDSQINIISRHLDMLKNAFNSNKTATPAPSQGVNIPKTCAIEGEYWLQDEPGNKSPFRYLIKNRIISAANFTNIKNVKSNCSSAGNAIRCVYTWNSNRLEIRLTLLGNYKLEGRYIWGGKIKQLAGWWKMTQLEDRTETRQKKETENRKTIDGTIQQKVTDPEEANILSEYCRLWPKFLREVTHPGCQITVVSCGAKSGNIYYFKYKYRCKSGFQWNEYNPQPSKATLAELKKLLRSMKARLGNH